MNISIKTMIFRIEATILGLLLTFGLCINVNAAEKNYTVINLMAEYFSFWDQTVELSPEEKSEIFKLTMMTKHADVYNPDVIKLLGSENADEKLQKHLAFYFEAIEPRLDHIRQLSEQAGTEFELAEARFLTLFDDFSYEGEIYFLPSLLYFDGATRSVKGATALLLAPDGMSYYHGDGFKIAPLFHHELFHVYHDQFMPEQKSEPLYLALWREGLAVHAAKTLNPEATPGQLVLMDLMETLPPVLGQVTDHFAGIMEQPSEHWYGVYFSDGKHEFIPPRAGYYLGQLVAREISSDMSWAQMMNLQGPALQAQIRRVLKLLATHSSRS
jgi:hypothetical protein